MPAQPLSRQPFPDPRLGLVDAERRAQFEEDGAHFESRYYLTLLWLPPADDAARAEAWLYESRARRRRRTGAQRLTASSTGPIACCALLEGFMPEADWLDDAETLTYLHLHLDPAPARRACPRRRCISTPSWSTTPLTGGLEPRLGDAHLRTLTVMGFPSQTWPGLLDELNRLAFPYRWVDARHLPRQDRRRPRCSAKIRRQWFAKRKSIIAILKEVMTNEASVLLDTDAANKALDADAALQELGSDARRPRPMSPPRSRSGTTIPRIADEQLRLVEQIIQGRDFTCMRETRERGRGLARQPARPCLRQCPPAAGLDPQPRPHDAVLGGLGRAGTGRASRRRRRCSSPGPKARRRSASRSMSAMSATRWSSARPAPARACCWR